MQAASWSSRWAFLLAAIGFAVGLGNIWRFPWVAGENGGSAFVLVYLLCVLAIGVPILMAELLIGRRGRGSPPEALAALAAEQGTHQQWRWLGHLNLLAAFLIQIVYTVVIGWVLFYLYLSLTQGFTAVSAEQSVAAFEGVKASFPIMMFWTGVALLLACAIVFSGLEKGIEPAVRVLMPMLFFLMLALAIFNGFNDGFDKALSYLFKPDFSKVTGTVMLAAVGQAFFSIGVAMAGMMMFAAYLPKDVSIGQSAGIIVGADTLVAITAGLVIFPVVFRFDLRTNSGSGLIFETLPVAFGQMPGGDIVAMLFFVLLSVAGVTSLVGLLEPLVSWIGERFEISRRGATASLFVAVLTGSILSILSHNVLSETRVFGSKLETVLDFIPNQLLLPVGGLLIAIFAGWVLKLSIAREELALPEPVFSAWRNLLRFVVVPAVILILITGLAS